MESHKEKDTNELSFHGLRGSDSLDQSEAWETEGLPVMSPNPKTGISERQVRHLRLALRFP